jgi:cytochrome c peroxidase
MKKFLVLLVIAASVFLFIRCSKSDATKEPSSFPAVEQAFGTNIDLNNLANYAAQGKPVYITRDNTTTNPISDKKATLGRVLFYDNALSIDNSISCGSCHKQTFAFSDTALVSRGVSGGLTGRHSMRLINARFSIENKFFWNERAPNLEFQTTQPVQDHAEMGFSGQAGRPGISSLLSKLQTINYYKELFQFVYDDATVTEQRLQECLAQFIRSIQSFDSKYDAGRAQVANDNQPLPNFTPQENTGKNLFQGPPVFDATGNRTAGGVGCAGCHRAPEFDIDPNTGNNGIVGNASGSVGLDLNNTRAPSLRDLVQTNGTINGPMMHTGIIKTLQAAVGHYGTINLARGNNNLDPRLRPNGFGQQLHLTAQEVNSVIAFLQTLSGTNVYTDKKWSNPFR